MASTSLLTFSSASLCALLAATNAVITVTAAGLPQVVPAPTEAATTANVVPTVTAKQIKLPSSAFGSAIEGAAVNANGDVFAADYRAGGFAPSAAYGYFFERTVGASDVLDLSQNPIFNAGADSINNTTENPPLLAGGRFLGDGNLLLTGECSFLIACHLSRWKGFADIGESQMLRTSVSSKSRDPSSTAPRPRRQPSVRILA